MLLVLAPGMDADQLQINKPDGEMLHFPRVSWRIIILDEHCGQDATSERGKFDKSCQKNWTSASDRKYLAVKEKKEKN